MADPRLLEWLELTRRALKARDDEQTTVLSEITLRRGELQQSLEESPPTEPIETALALKLQTSEDELARLITKLRSDVQDRIGDLREVQQAAQGYKPSQPNHPAFLSRSV